MIADPPRVRYNIHATPKRGEVPEWSKGAVLKTVVAQVTVGSNPTLSATIILQLRLPTKLTVFCHESTKGHRIQQEM